MVFRKGILGVTKIRRHVHILFVAVTRPRRYVLIIYKAVSRINTRLVKRVRVFIESVKWINKVITKTKRIVQ